MNIILKDINQIIEDLYQLIQTKDALLEEQQQLLKKKKKKCSDLEQKDPNSKEKVASIEYKLHQLIISNDKSKFT